MYLFTLLLSVAPIQATLRVGRISNATWQLDPTTDTSRYVNITERTCEQCVCLMLTNELSTRIACQPSVFTCQLLFMNATAQLRIDQASIVYLLNETDQGLTTTHPSLATTVSTDQQSTATTFFRKHSVAFLHLSCLDLF